MNEIKLLTVYRQEMHNIQIKNGFTDEQMTSYRQGFMDAIREYERRIVTDVQPVVHGKWDTHDVVKVLCSGKTLDGFCQCEACGDVFPLAYSEYNYCPNCGARMGGDTE